MTGRSQSALALQASPSWPRPWNPASPMRWSATAWTVSDGKMGICTAGTTSRRMRSGSRRASSMAMRPAPRRPRFSLRPAARAGAGLHGKAALIHPPVQRRRRSGLHRDRQAVLARPARSGACASLAPWFDDWISQDNLGDPGRLMVALFPPLARALKKQLALGALQASPDAPHHYDSHFWTDGEHVYRWPGDQPVPGAAPDFPAGHARQRHGLGVLHGWTTGLVPPPHGGGRARTGA